jgi:Kef-type K+ transport system membrane component KefB
VIAQIGVILFMFSVGLELDPRLMRSRAHVTVVIAHASIVLPFLLGSLLALWLYPRLSSSDVTFSAFTLFLGVSMSVTAFPVLARILADRGMQRSRLGVLALTCAAVGDVSAWCLLAFVVSVVRSQVGNAFWTFAFVALYVGLMLALVRPLVRRLVERHDATGLTQGALSLITVGLLLSALATEWIGVHALFGAFLFGALIPHDSRIARELIRHIESLVLTLFLPVFFAFTGLHTRIGLVSGLEGWLWCGVIVLVASIGKFGGCYVGARATGFVTRDAAALGVLMNTRGLMELIVLSVGLELGVVTPTLYAMLVIMALVTTLATAPLLEWLRVRPDAEPAAACPRTTS